MKFPFRLNILALFDFICRVTIISYSLTSQPFLVLQETFRSNESTDWIFVWIIHHPPSVGVSGSAPHNLHIVCVRWAEKN